MDGCGKCNSVSSSDVVAFCGAQGNQNDINNCSRLLFASHSDIQDLDETTSPLTEDFDEGVRFCITSAMVLAATQKFTKATMELYSISVLGGSLHVSLKHTQNRGRISSSCLQPSQIQSEQPFEG